MDYTKLNSGIADFDGQLIASLSTLALHHRIVQKSMDQLHSLQSDKLYNELYKTTTEYQDAITAITKLQRRIEQYIGALYLSEQAKPLSIF